MRRVDIFTTTTTTTALGYFGYYTCHHLCEQSCWDVNLDLAVCLPVPVTTNMWKKKKVNGFRV